MWTMDIMARGAVDRRDYAVRIILVDSNGGVVTFHPIRETYPDAPSLAARLATMNNMNKSPAYGWHRMPARPWPSGFGLFHRLGFGYERYKKYASGLPVSSWGVAAPGPPAIRYTITDRMITFPHWFPLLVFTALPAWWSVARIREARRIREGCCKTCGYDLTGNVSGACPECGGKVP
jgi:hypothetical protein